MVRAKACPILCISKDNIHFLTMKHTSSRLSVGDSQWFKFLIKSWLGFFFTNITHTTINKQQQKQTDKQKW